MTSLALNAVFLGSVGEEYLGDVVKSEDTQTAADKFYQCATELLEQYYPLKTITVTNKDPDFITAEIKQMLRRKNRLMRKGLTSEAGALLLKSAA